MGNKVPIGTIHIVNPPHNRTLTFQKNFVICFIESALKMKENAFYFTLKALFVLKIFRFFSQLFGPEG